MSLTVWWAEAFWFGYLTVETRAWCTWGDTWDTLHANVRAMRRARLPARARTVLRAPLGFTPPPSPADTPGDDPLAGRALV